MAAKAFGVPLDVPFKDLSSDQQQLMLYGSGDKEFHFHYENKFGKVQDKMTTYEGVIPNVKRRYHNTSSQAMGDVMRQYMTELTCETCHGKRLNRQALSVKVGGHDIAEVTNYPISQSRAFFENLQLSEQNMSIAKPILRELKSRLNFLDEVGLDYLTLDRSAGTLSGGEAQRIRLATQIGSNL